MSEDTSADDGSARMPAEATAPDDELISRLTVIDQQPLERRAEAFAQIHEELRSVLDS